MRAGACRVCGCVDNRACPGGCYWLEPELCSTCANTHVGTADVALFVEPVDVQMLLGQLLAVHGFVATALHHPSLEPRAPDLVRRWLDEVGELLVVEGVISEELRLEARRPHAIVIVSA